MGSDDESTRGRVLEAVRRFPGIHFRGLVKELDTSTSLARYHLQALLDERRIRQAEIGGFVRYFPADIYRELGPRDRELLHLLRQEKPLEIVLALLEFGAMQHRDLHEVVPGAKGTLTYHLQKLQEAGVVHRVARGEERGFHLVDPDHMRELLAQYEPASDILDHVHDMWEDLFGGHRRRRGQ